MALNNKGFTARNLLRKAEGKLSFSDFITSKNIGKINEEIRDSLLKEKLYIDLSAAALAPGGSNWTDFEVQYIRKAFKLLIPEIEAGEGVSVIKDKIFIETKGGKSFKSIFRRGNFYFDLILKEAGELIKKEYTVKSLSEQEATVLSLKLEKGETLSNEELHSLAFSRLSKAKAGAAGKVFDVQKGHVEGHENFRLATAKRLAYAMKVAGIDELPDELAERVHLIIGINEEVFNKFSAQFALQLEKGSRGTRIPEDLLVTQTITIERGRNNTIKGSKEETEISRLVLEQLNELFIEWSKKDDTVKKLFNVGYSPSYLQRVEKAIMGLLLGRKGARYNKEALKDPKSKSKIEPIVIDQKLNNIAKKVKAKANKRPDLKTASTGFESGMGLDLFNLKELINQMLAKNIEKEMDGSGGKLQYRTGRFADSAKLLTLTRAQSGILAGTYTYMRDPYDVFLPGHKMGTPTRDPRIYVEGAAREAAITILKNKFPGIALELQ